MNDFDRHLKYTEKQFNKTRKFVFIVWTVVAAVSIGLIGVIVWAIIKLVSLIS